MNDLVSITKRALQAWAIPVGLLATTYGYSDPAGSVTGAGAATTVAGKASPPSTPTTVQVMMSNAIDAAATFDSFSADSCVETNVFVSPISGDIVKIIANDYSRSSDSALFVFVNRYDYCHQRLLLNAFGDAPPVTFQLSSSLNSARTTGVVTLNDAVSSTHFDVRVDVTWTGSGPPAQATPIQHSSLFPGGVANIRITGFTRPATASGTIMSATDDLAPVASVSAEIDRAITGEIDITPVASGTSASAKP